MKKFEKFFREKNSNNILLPDRLAKESLKSIIEKSFEYMWGSYEIDYPHNKLSKTGKYIWNEATNNRTKDLEDVERGENVGCIWGISYYVRKYREVFKNHKESCRSFEREGWKSNLLKYKELAEKNKKWNYGEACGNCGRLICPDCGWLKRHLLKMKWKNKNESLS